MSQKYEKLKILLKELFQLDQPDLDFGLYRVMHAKSAEVSQFLDKDLLPQVKVAFGLYQSADKAELEKELTKVIAGIGAAGMNPDDSPKVKDLRGRLKSDVVDIGALESEVYDHLFSFGKRERACRWPRCVVCWRSPARPTTGLVNRLRATTRRRCGTRSSASPWRCPPTARGASPPSCGAKVG